MGAIATLFAVGQVSSLGFGAAITYYAARAYWRSGSPAIRSLAVGFGCLTLGALAAVVLFIAAAGDLLLAAGVQSLFAAVGLGFLTYALYVRDSHLGGPSPTGSPVRSAAGDRSGR